MSGRVAQEFQIGKSGAEFLRFQDFGHTERIQLDEGRKSRGHSYFRHEAGKSGWESVLYCPIAGFGASCTPS